MFSASQLTEEQKETIYGWVAEGAQMSDVQKHLKEEFDLSVTYMDTRFLSLDLDLQFIKEEEPEPSNTAGGSGAHAASRRFSASHCES
jgi:hypothetical protein